MTGNVPHTVRKSPEQAADIIGIRIPNQRSGPRDDPDTLTVTP